MLSADDFLTMDPSQAKEMYTGVKGIGYVTFEYFSMLLGIPGVKTDVMIKRFVSRAMASAGLDDVYPITAERLIREAYEATGLGQTLTHFDHSVWL